jgi:glycosyltransferase involved in cell wall biosynthesis
MKKPRLIHDWRDFTKVTIPKIKETPDADNENRPKWSVMIPTYNRSDFLEEALKSVLAQDPGPELMQIEVVDDGSTQGDSENLVRDVGKGRVEFYKQPQNVGPPLNWNTCVERARGKWVQILHDDDSVDMGYYAAIDKLIEAHPDLVFAYTRIKTIDDESVWTKDYEPPLTGMTETGVWDDAAFHMTSNNMICVSGVLVRRDAYTAIGGYSPDLVASFDWELWQRLAHFGPFGFLWDSMASYRRHSATLTDKNVKNGLLFRDMLHIMTLGLSRLSQDRRAEAEKTGRGLYRGLTRHYCRRLIEQKDWDALYQVSTWGYRISPHIKMARWRAFAYMATLLS